MMLHIIFNVGVVVAIISLIFASVIMMRYQLNQIRSCVEAQNKIVAALELTQKAHEITFEALRATEEFLKYVAETSQAHDEILTRLMSKVDWLERSAENLQEQMDGLTSISPKSDNLK